MLRSVFKRQFHATARLAQLDAYEQQIHSKLSERLTPTALAVKDVSGGCGSMFNIQIESPKFQGLTTIKQHRLVNDVLQDEIKQWHGLQLRTKPSKPE